MYANYEHNDQNVNTEPWDQKCPSCSMAASELNFALSNNMNSTRYLQALEYINSMHELFTTILIKEGIKIALPHVPNFLLMFTNGRNESINKTSNVKKTPRMNQSLKTLTQKKEKTKMTSSWNVDLTKSKIRPVLIPQEVTAGPECHSTEKLRTDTKLLPRKSFARRKFLLPPSERDKFMFRSQPENSFIRCCSDNILKLKNGMQYNRKIEKKRNKNKLKLSQSSPPPSQDNGMKNVEMQT